MSEPESSNKEAATAASPEGQYCIIRSTGSGVWAGIVVKHSGSYVTISGGRRLWTWKATKGHTLSAVANYGISEGKLPASVPVAYISGSHEIIPCSQESRRSIEEMGAHNE